jgi:hypothetical protein
MELDLNPLHYTSGARNNVTNIFNTEVDENQPNWVPGAGANGRLNTAKSDHGKRGFLTAAKFDTRH